MKRAGRLVYFTCGDGALTALDVMTGAVVWRVRDRLRFRAPPTVAHDALFVVAGGAHGVARLYSHRPLLRATCAGREHVADAAPAVHRRGRARSSPTARRRRRRPRRRAACALAAFRRDGRRAHRGARAPRVVAPSGTSWLAVDDAFIGNAPTGELVAIGATHAASCAGATSSGPRPLEADVPRRLEPVLRSGALFVPHTDVAVIRPRDGAVLGTIAPTDAIPDLLRVDERCDVYVAEESGHLVLVRRPARACRSCSYAQRRADYLCARRRPGVRPDAS